MSKEHEVIMLLNKGHDMLSRSAHRNGSGDTRNLQRDLDKIQQQWDRLRKDTVERHTRLQTCMVRERSSPFCVLLALPCMQRSWGCQVCSLNNWLVVQFLSSCPDWFRGPHNLSLQMVTG
jgi:hypothetical protein